MSEYITVDQMWENLKEDSDNAKITIEAANESIKIINKLVEARKKAGLSQRQLAEKCGMKQSALARIETYNVIPQISTLIKIAKIVGVTISAYTEEEQSSKKIAEGIAFLKGILMVNNTSFYQNRTAVYNYRTSEGVKIWQD